MIEGQEGVTWDDWVALASACEEHGVEALFRSDHYISWFDATYSRLEGAPGFHRPDLTTLVGGSAKPGTAGPAVRFANEYNTLFGTLDEVRDRKQALDEACERGERDPSTLRYSLMAPCVIGRDEREVLASARRIGARFGRDPQEVLERYGDGPVGTIAEAAERLKQIEEIGYERVMLQHLVHDDLETVALIGRELAPAVA